MPRITMIVGIALIALGIGFLLATYNPPDKPPWTALIASGFGLPVAILGVFAGRGSEKARMHMAHAAVMITLLGAIGGFVMGSLGLRKDPVREMAVIEQFIMGGICLLHVFLSVRSFIAVRKAREAAAQTEGQAAPSSDSPTSTDE